MKKKLTLLICTIILCFVQTINAQDWRLIGNTATNPNTNFVGTTDNAHLNFRTNNSTRMTILANGNVGIGTPNPVARLDIYGSVRIVNGTQGAGKVLTSDATGVATWQTPSGGSADAWSRLGNSNIIDGTHFLGTTTNVPLNFRVNNQKAGRIDPTLFNTFFGYQTGNANTTGNESTAFGHGSLVSNTTGDDNTALGKFTLYFNTSGYGNTASGVQALYNNNGALNSAFGHQALFRSTTGILNIGVGHQALQYNTTGNHNVGVGYNTGNNSGIVTSNLTAIGTNAGHVGSNSNTVEIGNTSMTWIGGQSGWFLYSDKRIKENIQNNVPGLAFISKLNPVTYNLNIHKQNEICGISEIGDWEGKYDIEKITQTGFLAQEVEAAAKACEYDFNGVVAPTGNAKLYSVQYASFVVPLVKAVQELNDKNNKLEFQNTELLKRIEKLEAIANIKNGLETSVLEQNSPNPFSENTTIRYSVASAAGKIEIKIFSAEGKEIQSFASLPSSGQIEITGNTLSPGLFTYCLIADGKMVDSKQMILTK